jgi:hypothetical protein
MYVSVAVLSGGYRRRYDMLRREESNADSSELNFLLLIFQTETRCVAVVHPRGTRTLHDADEHLTDSQVSHDLLRRDFEFLHLDPNEQDLRTVYPRGPLLPLYVSRVCELVEQFQFFTCKQLRVLASAHGLPYTARSRRPLLLDLLRLHRDCSCLPIYLVFHRTTRPRWNVRLVQLSPPEEPRVHGQCSRTEGTEDAAERRRLSHNLSQHHHRQRVAEGLDFSAEETSFPQIKGFDEKLQIIREWQEVMAPSRFVESACAVCAWSYPPSELSTVQPSTTVLKLLRNDCLPAHVLPASYDIKVYSRAILCPEGMTSLRTVGPVRMCLVCQRALQASPPRQPKFALANFLYYGRERLPADVLDAFCTASPFDLQLISRCRSSTITHHFVRRGARGGYIPEERSQRFNRGNVAIFPQDPGPLRDVLPPDNHDIRDTVCVLFSGGGSRPTADTLKRFGPVLVRKSKVKNMINFLVDNNEWYQAAGIRYSEANMANLFGPSEEESDVGVLQFMQVEDAGNHHAIDSDDDQWQQIQDEIVMDNVAYTCGDHSPRSRESMKVHALAYALDRKRFINSQAGINYVGDSHPGLLSYLFPHLDPWGIGGFNHPGRSASQRLSFAAQVKCLLRQFRSPFTTDPYFAFVTWNMIQKQSASRHAMFSMKASSHRRIAQELSNHGPALTDIANKWTRDPYAKANSEKEKQVLSLLRKLEVSSKNTIGSAGYKLCRRNEIRSLIRRFSTPVLFLTLNPHDLSSVLLGVLGGVGEDSWRAMSAYQRAAFVAAHPGAAARAFDTEIKAFLDVIVRYGKGSGLFGTCTAYYVTIETQGRGTLHAHLRLWLEGNPSPQQLRDRMVTHTDFQESIFRWMEDTIKCELPGMTRPLHAADVGNACDDADESEDCRLQCPPQASELDAESFSYEYQKFVHRLAVKCNWHVHNDTCYKHLTRDQPRTDGNCRMRINGQTRAVTMLDDDTRSILLRRLHPWINNFNDVVLFLLQSNMDIKYIGSGPAAKALVYYITDYITKSDLKIHCGVQTLHAAIKCHSEKFKHDHVSSESFRDRNLVTKCINSLNGRLEISHQQVMSYLIGGGDYYTSHDFRPFRFYDFMKGLDLYERSRDDHLPSNGESNEDEDDLEENAMMDVSNGDPTIVSDILDYQMRPLAEPFNAMSLWEFIERTRKVSV